MTLAWEVDDLLPLPRPTLITEDQLAEERDTTVQLAIAKALQAVDERFNEALVTRDELPALLTEALHPVLEEVTKLHALNETLSQRLQELERRPSVVLNVPPSQQSFEIKTPPVVVPAAQVHVEAARPSDAPPPWWRTEADRKVKRTVTAVDRDGMPTETIEERI